MDITSETMCQLTDKIRQIKQNQQLEELLQLIKNRASCGYYSTTADETLMLEVKDELLRRGFVVEAKSPGGTQGHFYNITWLPLKEEESLNSV